MSDVYDRKYVPIGITAMRVAWQDNARHLRDNHRDIAILFNRLNDMYESPEKEEVRIYIQGLEDDIEAISLIQVELEDYLMDYDHEWWLSNGS